VYLVAKVPEKLAYSIFIFSVIGDRNYQVYAGIRSIELTGRSEEIIPIPDEWNCDQINLTHG
jgi:hypothetical protein